MNKKLLIGEIFAMLFVAGLIIYIWNFGRMEEYPPIELDKEELVNVLSSPVAETQEQAEDIREAYSNLRSISDLDDENISTEERDKIIKLLKSPESASELPPGFEQRQ